jgi:RNA polymerase sigma factor FliA
LQSYKYRIENREQIIEKLLPLVKRIAGRLALGLPPQVDKDDLIGSGILGLLDALDKYNPAKGPLKNYVALRVRGAMLDDLRKMSWLPRNLLLKAKQIESASATLRGSLVREPSADELAAHLEIDTAELSRLMAYINQKAVISLEEYLFSGTEGEKQTLDYIADSSADNSPEQIMLKKDQMEKLERALNTLTEREQLILNLYYREELTLKEIGQTLDITESRVCQIHGNVMLKLRQLLKE